VVQKMRLPEEEGRPLQINMVPMIDVIFSILAFFILSTLFLTPSKGVNVNLPEAVTAEDQAQSALRVSLDRQGEIRFQDQVVTLDRLVAVLQGARQNNQDLVIIQADLAVEHGRVVAVMDQLRQIPNLRLAIATIPPKQ
jgi:biopolymer transport protein ExbD